MIFLMVPIVPLMSKFKKCRAVSIILQHFNFFVLHHLWLDICLTNVGDDSEEKLMPKIYSAQYVTIPHRSLDSVIFNYIKIVHWKAYLYIHKIDFTCVPVAY